MKCPRCQAEISPAQKFCGECGVRLAAVCTTCEASNPPGQRFCGECGALLVQAAPPKKFGSPESYTPKHLAEKILTSRSALEGERKQVTVLFADLKGSMELLANRDPEEAHQLLDPVLERLMEAVHRYEGTVNQVMGDGIMALFGAPLAHEDHAIRACYAALAMQESVSRFGDEVQRAGRVPVQIRVGLNSGEVVVRSVGSDLRMDYTAVGQTTHLAARMEQIAKAGSVLITAATLKLAEGYVHVKPLGPVPVKGLESPVEVYEVMGAGPVRTRLQAAALRGLTRFVGRQVELEALRQALAKARAGHGQVVALVGEPGVGKSRLFWEFTHSPQTHGWLILDSGSVSYGKATPYLPAIDLLKGYFQIEARDDTRKIREKITGKLLTLDEALRPVLPAFLALLDVPVDDSQWQAIDPRQRRQRTLDAVKRLLLRESRAQALCLVFDDLHWIDPETQALLDSLIESLPTTRLLLLVNYRPEYQHGWGGKTYYTQLRIDPLPPESCDELLQALLGDDARLQPLKRLLIDRTEGNPFFLEESVRTLVETAVLVGGRGSYRVARPLEAIQVPATVQAVLDARIDRLPPEEKRLLQSAAVIGKDVPFAVLHAIADMPEDELQPGLAHLQAAEFLYEASLFPDLEYTFKHALTHEVAYGSLLQERRRALHGRILAAIEALHADRLAEHVERLAHHALRGELWDKAAVYCQQAGVKAALRSANLEAMTYYEQALGALGHLPEDRDTIEQNINIRVDLGPILTALKGPGSPEVEEAYTRAQELCERLGETTQRFPVLWGLWYMHFWRAELEVARELAEQLLAVARQAQDLGFLLEAHHTLWPTLFDLGELVSSREHWEQGIGLYDPQQHRSLAFVYGSHDPGACARWHAGRTLWLLGYPDQALKISRDSIRTARELAHPLTITFAHHYCAVLHHLRGEREAAQELTGAVVKLSTDHGFAPLLAFGTMVGGRLLVEQGRGEEGIAQLRQGMAALEATETGRKCYYQVLLAGAYGMEGQIENGLSVLAAALAAAQVTGERHSEAELYRLKGEFLLKLAPPAVEQAEGCFRQAIEIARQQRAKSWELRAVMGLSRLWHAQGKREDARRALEEVYRWFTEGFDTSDLKEAKGLLEEIS